MAHESMEYEVVIVGAGPAGLACAIRYAQLCREANKQPSICVLEKGAEVGAHVLSGAVIETRALDELLPDWKTLGAPIHTKATCDEFLILTEKSAFKMPTPPQMRNEGNYIISLGLLCRWLAKQAESLGVEIYPGFAASHVLYNDNNEVLGVATNDLGRDKQGNPKPNFQNGMHLLAKHTVFAEGCRGSLTQTLIKHYALAKDCQPQTYAIGIKEIWEINQEQHQLGKITHSVGWPLDHKTYGGSFIYHWDNNQLSIGLVIGLDYENPYLNPYEAMQSFKHHPKIAALLKGGRCISYGARALNEGGWQSIPQLTFPGGLLVGCAAGFMNVPKIKGSHTAMKSGMLAAESLFSGKDYEQAIKNSWIKDDLYPVRNIRPGFRFGLLPGLLYAGIDTYLLRGKAPWTFSHKADYTYLKPAKDYEPIVYPKHDGILSFDKMTSLSRANVYHDENQPVHLKLTDPSIAVNINWKIYNGPEARYCPAGVYEFIDDQQGNKQLHINAQNCIHCKTCDIKDPTQNITWETPEGGGGPNYSNM